VLPSRPACKTELGGNHLHGCKTVPIFVVDKGEDGNVGVSPACLPRYPKRVRGFQIRNSDRWADSAKIPHGAFNVPFIDNLGRFTGITLYKWYCDPRQLLASTVATIAQRLEVYCRRHNKNFVVKRNLPRILRCASYYAMTKNAWYWDRILFFSRNLEKHGKRLLHLTIKYVNKGDDNKRFVYSQVSSQTNWLLFRAKRPRDKSLFIQKGMAWTSRVTGKDMSSEDRRYLIPEIAKEISRV
jgi:hypothetical protein